MLMVTCVLYTSHFQTFFFFFLTQPQGDPLAPSPLICSQVTMLASLKNQCSLRSAAGLHTLNPTQSSWEFQSFPGQSAQSAHHSPLPPVTALLSLGPETPCPLILCLLVGSGLTTLLTDFLVGFRSIHHLCRSTTGLETSSRSDWFSTDLHVYVRPNFPCHKKKKKNQT